MFAPLDKQITCQEMSQIGNKEGCDGRKGKEGEREQ